MSIDKAIFETLTPLQYLTFTVSNKPQNRSHLHTSSIRVAVLDSPVAVAAGVLPITGAILVPKRGETDWKFCTESGHRQLLFEWAPGISRLILISNNFPPNSHHSDYIRLPETDTADADREKLEEELQTKLYYLNQKVCFRSGFPKFPFLPCEDGLLYRVIVARFKGPVVDEFVVEDVLMDGGGEDDGKLLRNLTFKRMPKFIQSQVPLWPFKTDGKLVTESLNLKNLKKMKKKNVRFQFDTKKLVHSHLTCMVFGLNLIASHLCERYEQGVAPRALCLGVGGGALLSFLNTELEFEVVGMEADKDVLTAAEQHFGFKESDSIQVIVGDAVKEIQDFQSTKTKGETDDSKVKNDVTDARFDVVMVDLDSSEPRYGICAPPQEFVEKSVIEAVKLLLHDHGVVIINVVYSVKDLFYEKLVQELKGAFYEVNGTDVEEDKNLVLMATVSPPTSSHKDEGKFCQKLSFLIKDEVYEDYEESIVDL